MQILCEYFFLFLNAHRNLNKPINYRALFTLFQKLHYTKQFVLLIKIMFQNYLISVHNSMSSISIKISCLIWKFCTTASLGKLLNRFRDLYLNFRKQCASI